ncbi:CoA transferase [Aminipila butyrica]|uniref:CoA transferase n=1 Tax=Aminipila butyrica TaxID=433296 RepID=A0A858BVE3_9FIRM|nr:CoA transferase [Aminipila butyrica]QIB69078.1 CoA transferase [Aminipila butyrica]
MKPLQDMTVLDLTRVVAGPYSTMILADLGARVIKVENPDDPDYIRTFEPFLGEGDNKFSGFFAQYNRHKLGITLSLKKEEAQAMFKEMVKKVDVVIENYRPGVMKKFALDYQVLKEINPKLIYVALSGFGQDGPYVKWPSYDNSGQALSGLWSINGFSDRPPVRVGTIIGDESTTFFGTIGLLAAYIHAQKTGQGQMVDVAQLDSTFCLTEVAVPNCSIAGKVQGPLGNDHPFIRPYGMFQSRTGYIFFGGYTDKFFKATCAFFGEPELAADPELDSMDKRFQDDVWFNKLKPKYEEWFSRYTTEELVAGLSEVVPLTPINSIAEAMANPQLNARDMIIDYPHGNQVARLFGTPIKLSETPADPIGPAPRLGQHNKEIYQEFLGFSEEELKELHEKGVI